MKHFKKNNFLVFIFSLIQIASIGNSEISFKEDSGLKFYILPLSIESHLNEIKINQHEDMYKELMEVRYLTNISLGKPMVTLPSDLSLDFYSLYITSEKSKQNIQKYNENKSSTYEKNTEEQFVIENQKCFRCIFAKETFHLYDNKKIRSFPSINFVLGTDLKDKYNTSSATIGLKAKITTQDLLEDNLINQLRKEHHLSEYTFRLRFSNNDDYIANNIFQSKGEFIIGAYPHQYMPKLYKEENYKFFYIGVDNPESNDWDFKPREIKYGNLTSYNGVRRIQIRLNSGFFKVTEGFMNIIKVDFFQEYLENGACVQEKYSMNPFQYFICNESIDFSKFQNISFFPLKNDFNLNLTFTYKDLFMKFTDVNGTNKYFFLMIFDSYTTWEIGDVFFHKYQPIFDYSKKTIGFYDQLFIEEEDKYQKKENNIDEGGANDEGNQQGKIITILIIVIVILGIVIGIIAVGFCIYRHKYHLRNKRANELHDDDYLYESENKIINNGDTDNNDNEKKTELNNKEKSKGLLDDN